MNYFRSKGPNTLMNGAKSNVQVFCLHEKILENSSLYSWNKNEKKDGFSAYNAIILESQISD